MGSKIIRNPKKTPYLVIQKFVKTYKFKHEIKIEAMKNLGEKCLFVRIPVLSIDQPFKAATM
jgi:hypothetical protein